MIKKEEKQITTEVTSYYCDFCGDLLGVSETSLLGINKYKKPHKTTYILENIKIDLFDTKTTTFKLDNTNIICNECKDKLLLNIKNSIKQIVEDMKLKEEE